jgi:hypothetical protein
MVAFRQCGSAANYTTKKSALVMPRAVETVSEAHGCGAANAVLVEEQPAIDAVVDDAVVGIVGGGALDPAFARRREVFVGNRQLNSRQYLKLEALSGAVSNFGLELPARPCTHKRALLGPAQGCPLPEQKRPWSASVAMLQKGQRTKPLAR